MERQPELEALADKRWPSFHYSQVSKAVGTDPHRRRISWPDHGRVLDLLELVLGDSDFSAACALLRWLRFLPAPSNEVEMDVLAVLSFADQCMRTACVFPEATTREEVARG